VAVDPDANPEIGRVRSALQGILPDPNTQLFIVTNDEGEAFPLLVSNSRGYRLTCLDGFGATDASGLLGLVDGAGFDRNALEFYPHYTYQSVKLQEALGIYERNVSELDLGALPCRFNSANGYLLSIDVAGRREYFLDMNEVDSSQPDAAKRNNILRTVSCGELLRAMGLDLRQAMPVDLQIANLHWILDDQYNINCRAGTPPAQFVPTLAVEGGGLNQVINRGKSIAPIVFRVSNLGPNDVATLVAATDECGPLLIDGLRVTGTVSKTAPNKTCKTTFVARVPMGKDPTGNDILYETPSLTLSIDLSCEINSTANCGACGAACVTRSNQTVSCEALTAGGADYSCRTPCNGGWADCDGNTENGCEARLDSLTNCGTCGNACVPPHMSMNATCAGTACKIDCKANFADCDGNLANGCEANLFSVTTCNSCGTMCHPDATCANTLAGGACQCLPSYVGNGTKCLNECYVGNGGCSSEATCKSSNGQKTCTCNEGFSGDGVTCININECLTNNGGCSPNAACGDTMGSRTCSCKYGFQGDGITCININECLTNNGGCSPNATCRDTEGSHTCSCKDGFAGDGITCININECLTNNGGCSPNATCRDTEGSHTCSCNGGFQGDGITCAPICAPPSCGGRTCGVVSNACGTVACGVCVEDMVCTAGYCRPPKKTCFVAGTPVTMADGEAKPIETVHVGDRVLSFDEASGALVEGAVAAVFVHPDTPALVRINGALVTTPEHRFYVDGEWIQARDLVLGQRLRAAAGPSGAGLGDEVKIVQIEALPGGKGVTTYNFEVEAYHVYFAGGVLVHNAKIYDP
jgi:hypothetical protein